MQNWKYFTLNWASGFTKWYWNHSDIKKMSFDEGLNHMGSTGWECFGCAAKNESGKAEDPITVYEYYFKKPMSG